MIPLNDFSQENIALASAHLQSKNDTVVTKAIEAVQIFWQDISLKIREFVKDSNSIDSHTYTNLEPQDMGEIEFEGELSTPLCIIQSTKEKIEMTWENYSAMWFYSSPFENESD